MSNVLGYESPPQTAGSPEDRRYMRLVEVGHYVWGGFILLPFAAMLLLSLFILPFHGLADEPGVSGLAMVLSMLTFAAVGTAMGALTVWSGRCVARRTRRTMIVGWAAVFGVIGVGAIVWIFYVEMLTPGRRIASGSIFTGIWLGLGTVLSVLTLSVLTRPTVIALYGDRDTSNGGSCHGQQGETCNDATS